MYEMSVKEVECVGGGSPVIVLTVAALYIGGLALVHSAGASSGAANARRNQ